MNSPLVDTPSSDGLRAPAAALLEARQVASVSLLQRTYKLGHGLALELMNALERDGVVSAKRPDGSRLLRRVPDLTVFAERILETTLFFDEMHRQGSGGHSGMIRVLNPYPAVGIRRIRALVLDNLLGSERLDLREAAHRLSEWNPDGSADTFDRLGLRQWIDRLCDEHDSSHWPADPIDREFYRLARAVYRAWAGREAHSRVFEYLMSESSVPQGRGHKGEGWREHVVPCAYLRDLGIQMFAQGSSISDVALVLRANLIVVNIYPSQATLLDKGSSGGGLALKSAMPAGWKVGDCPFARLHAAGITFDPPPSMALCSHG